MSERVRSVLIVEDDLEIASLVKLHLEDVGCRVALAHDGATGLRRAEGRVYTRSQLLELVWGTPTSTP